MEAINAPSGNLAQVLMRDPMTEGLTAAAGLPSLWTSNAESLLSLAGDSRQHALTIFAYHLPWLFTIDPSWTARNVLASLDDPEVRSDALWAGLLWRGHPPPPLLFRQIKIQLLSLVREPWVAHHNYLESLAGILLMGWTHNEDGERMITHAELREALLTNDDFRAQVLWLLERWAAGPAETSGEGPAEPDTGEVIAHWRPEVPILLREAWPRNRVAKTSMTSARLCELAFSSVALFKEVAELVEGFLAKVEGQQLMLLYKFIQKPAPFIRANAEKTLALLWTVLSDDIHNWPYQIHTVFDQLEEIQPELSQDSRLIELRRRWNAR